METSVPADIITRVHELVKSGDVEQAAKLLGHFPHLQGTIVHGEKRGRTIGYPTANLGEWDVNAEDVVPVDGIYAGWLSVSRVNEEQQGADSAEYVPAKGNHGFRSSDNDGYDAKLDVSSYSLRLPAAISVGTNPTFDGQRSRQVEAFVLNQNKWIDLYGQRAKVEFCKFLRPTVKFSGESWLEDLLAQMKSDCDRALGVLLVTNDSAKG